MLHVLISLAMLNGFIYSSTSVELPVKEVKTEVASGAPERVKIVFYMVLGRLRPDGSCKGFGICDFVLDIRGGISAETDHLRGEAGVDKGRLQLTINRHELPSRVFDTYLSTGQFRVEEAYRLSEEVCRKLQLPGRYTIEAGRYPVIQSGSQLQITF